MNPDVGASGSERSKLTTDERIAKCVRFLETKANVYRAFKAVADDQLLRNPGQQLSSELIVGLLRYDPRLKVASDPFKISSDFKPLLARLYCRERLEARFGDQPSWLDDLSPEQWKPILEAWQAGNGTATGA